MFFYRHRFDRVAQVSGVHQPGTITKEHNRVIALKSSFLRHFFAKKMRESPPGVS
jgi:hypothetical protein